METSSEKKWYFIDRVLLKVKAFYFFELASIGDLLPFMTLYMKQIGITESQAGITYGLMPFIGFLVRPIFGAVADKFKYHKQLLIVSCVLTGVFFNLLLLVPYEHSAHTQVHTNIMCSNGDSYLQDCYSDQDGDKCPMSFHSYMNKVKYQREPEVETIFSNSTPDKVVPYSVNTVTSIPDPSIDGKTACSLSCMLDHATFQASDFQICYTNSSGTYNVDDCLSVQTLDPKRKETEVKLVIPDIDNLLNSEVVADRMHLDGKTCKNYDLKQIEYNQKEYWQMLCSEDVLLKCTMKCSHVETCSVFETKALSTESFWIFFVLFLLGNITFSPIMSLGDAIAYDTLGPTRRLKWGKQRVFGTLGFALFAMISTVSMDLSQSKTKSFTVAFFIFTALNILTAIVAFFMHISKDIHSGGMTKGVMEILRVGRNMVFFLIIFYFGFLTGAIEAFLYWFLEKDLMNQHKIIPGLCILVGCISETIFLFFSGRIIKIFGQIQCLYLTFIAYFVRFIAYSFLENPWAVIPIEITHGVTFGVCWAAASSYASIIAPTGLSATFQGLLTGIHFGIGKGAGSLITGLLYSVIGIRWAYRIYAVMSVFLLLVYFLLNKCVFEDNSDEANKKSVGMEETIPGKEPAEVELGLLKGSEDKGPVEEYKDEPETRTSTDENAG